MIPRRRLSRTGFDNGVSCRMEACRRRLRLVRANEAQFRSDYSGSEWAFDSGGLNAEATPGVVRGLDLKGQDGAEIT